MMQLHTVLVALSQATADPGSASAGASFVELAEAWSTIFLAVVASGVLVGVLLVLLKLRSLSRSLIEVARRIEKDASPVLDRTRSVAENVEFITAAVRTDVQKVNESVSRLNDRLRQASDRMEERIQDFTALVEVLQEEAEALALDTAAAVRGVRAGTRSLAASGQRREGKETEALAPSREDLEEDMEHSAPSADGGRSGED